MVSWDAKEYITWLVKCHKILKYLQEFVVSHDMSKKVLETKPWCIKKAVCVLENSWKVLYSLWCPFNILLLTSWARFEFLLLWNLKDFFELCRLGRKLIQLISLLELYKFSHYIINFYCFVISYYLLHFLRSQEKSWIVTLSSLWMGHAMYFSLGNSNSLASVDISAGYVGLEDFEPSIMVPLTYVATYCGPCLWLMAGILSVIRNTSDSVRCVQVYLQITLAVSFWYFIRNTTQDGTVMFTIST